MRKHRISSSYQKCVSLFESIRVQKEQRILWTREKLTGCSSCTINDLVTRAPWSLSIQGGHTHLKNVPGWLILIKQSNQCNDPVNRQMPDAITSAVWTKYEYSKIYFLKSQLTRCGWEVEMAPPPTSQPNNPFRGRRTSTLLWCKASDTTSWNYTNKSTTGTEIKHAAISIPSTQLDWCLQ